MGKRTPYHPYDSERPYIYRYKGRAIQKKERGKRAHRDKLAGE